MARILAVDDDPSFLRLIQAALGGSGHQVDVTDDAPQALRAVRESCPDLFILDVQMPGMTGFSLLHLLRAEPKTANAPILFVSSIADSANRVYGLRQGADDFIAKPFDPQELSARVERLLERTAKIVAPFGRYEKRAEIASGGMATVYRGWDPALNRAVALKALHMQVENGERPERVAQLLREAITAAQLHHPNVVSVFDVVESADSVVIAMEYVEGVSLADYLGKQRTVAPERAVPLFAALARGLAVAHEQGIVHRDLKPENILLGSNGTIKIADFGLAEFFTSLTASTDKLFGTPGYMAPEILMGRAFDTRADLFALGVTLYYAVTGVHPFRADTIARVVARTVGEAPAPLQEVCPDLLEEAAGPIMTLLEKDPAKRSIAAAALARQLDDCAARYGLSWQAPLAIAAPPTRASHQQTLTMLSRSDLRANALQA
jgi:serine/threonine protein kinase/ActR/RegA family two-component response regulator